MKDTFAWGGIVLICAGAAWIHPGLLLILLGSFLFDLGVRDR